MANIPEFKYAPMFQLGEDTTEYRLVSKACQQESLKERQS